MSLQDAAAFLNAHTAFCIFCHVSPDGDALGSALALRLGLLQKGKAVRILCDASVFPHKYAFLQGSDTVEVGEKREVPQGWALVYMDCAALDRAGFYAPVLEEGHESLCIDHHVTNPGWGGKGYADVNYVEDCAAAGELVYLLLGKLGADITPDIAACLYTALATDTGNFAYEAVSPRTFAIMSRLMEAGLNLPLCNQLLFRRERLAKVKLTARVVDTMRLHRQGRLAVGSLTLEEIEEAEGISADCDGIIDTLRDMETVEAACFLRESRQGIKLSFRSKGLLNVAAIAQSFGGGGHVLAAGCTMHTSMEEAERRSTEALCRALEEKGL